MDLTFQVFKVGITTGVVFIISLSVMTRALEKTGVGLVFTAFRVAVILPVGASVLIWGEAVTLPQALGIGLALVALILMTYHPAQPGKRIAASALAIVLPVFVLQGLSHTCVRWVHYAGLDDRLPQVLCVIGGTAGVLGALGVVLRRYRPEGRDIRMGVGIGAYNAMALTVILTTLSVVPGAVFFPVLGCAVVVLDNVSAHFYWKELLSRPAVAGVALAVCAIILVVR
jgi:multidrug transporter EmrE-like cation transporter